MQNLVDFVNEAKSINKLKVGQLVKKRGFEAIFIIKDIEGDTALLSTPTHMLKGDNVPTTVSLDRLTVVDFDKSKPLSNLKGKAVGYPIEFRNHKNNGYDTKDYIVLHNKEVKDYIKLRDQAPKAVESLKTHGYTKSFITYLDPKTIGLIVFK